MAAGTKIVKNGPVLPQELQKEQIRFCLLVLKTVMKEASIDAGSEHLTQSTVRARGSVLHGGSADS